MPNIADIIEVAEELEDKPVLAMPRRCVVVRNRNASCRKCMDACLADAISIHNNVMAVDYKRCVGCGACATVSHRGARVHQPHGREACPGRRKLA